jgi:ParB family chromosome partitioning protein
MAKAPKMTLPAVNLDLKLESGKMKAITAAATGKENTYIVPVDQLRPLPGFNVRVRETEDYRQHVENLKQSITENGFYHNKPLAGFIGKEGDEDVIFVTDGYTRLEAVNEINAEDVDGTNELPGLPVSLKPADSTLADLTIALVQDNSGRPLTPYEMGVVVQRLAAMTDEDGSAMFTKSDIARRLSVTERYIDDLNVLVAAPAKVRNAVLRGEVSSTLAIQELRKNPKKAEERITAAVSKATAAGKTKATKKDIVGHVRMKKVEIRVSLATGDTMGAVLQSIAKQLREAIPHASKEEGDQLQVDGTVTLIAHIPASSEPEAPEAVEEPAKAEKAPKAAGKKAGAKKAAKTPADESEAPTADEGEPVRLPPAVPTVESDDPDDI